MGQGWEEASDEKAMMRKQAGKKLCAQTDRERQETREREAACPTPDGVVQSGRRVSSSQPANCCWSC